MRRRKFSVLEKNFIQERASHCCEYCKFPMHYSHDSFHIEHIIPIRFGGSNELENLAWSCDGCNTNKWGYMEWLDPQTGIMVALFNPRLDNWKSHFQWSADFTLILGLTTIGRATIDLLKMNRSGLINIRKALIAFGVLPLQ
jgi:5-methylcytosine-specific restriction endonuclease McrA